MSRNSSKPKAVPQWKASQDCPTIFRYSAKESKWSSGLDIVECGRVKPPVVVLSLHVHALVLTLLGQFEGTEWLAYLIGTESKKEVAVTDLFIPKQEVSAGDVQVKRFDFPPGMVGVIHSHHDMGAFFSSQDEGNVNKHHKLSIVVDSGGRYKATIKVRVPCGAALASVETRVMVGIDKSVLGFLEDAKTKIQKKTYSVSEPVGADWPPMTLEQRQMFLGENF